MFSTSLKGFSEKPTRNQTRFIRLQSKDLSLDDLERHIREGYALSALYSSSYPMTLKQKTYENFSFSSYIMFDLDNDVQYDLTTLVDSLAIQPTMAYTTFSHKKEGKGNRYRLLYLFDNPIKSIPEYKALYSYLCREINLNISDNCGNRAVQLCFGSKNDCELIRTDNVLNLEEIKEKEEYNDILYRVSGHQEYNKKEKDTLCSYCPPDITIIDSEYIKDYDRLTIIDLIDKYNAKYPLFESNMDLPQVNDDEPIITIPKDYIIIKRPSRPEPIILEDGSNNGYKLVPIKWKDGEGRRRKLFLNGILRRFMKSDITYEHLLHCLLVELSHYYFNFEDPITKEELKGIAERVMKTDIQRGIYLQFIENCKKCMPKYKVNKSYCLKRGLDPRSVSAQYRSNNKDEYRLQVFDPCLKEKENSVLFEEHRLGKGTKAVQRFRKKHGIGNWYERNKKGNDE